MFYTNDPCADFERYDAEQERELEKLPVCEYCGETIQDDYLYDVGGDIFCEDCLNEHFRKSVDSFMGW